MRFCVRKMWNSKFAIQKSIEKTRKYESHLGASKKVGFNIIQGGASPPWGSPMGGGYPMGDPHGGSQEGTPADIWTCEIETLALALDTSPRTSGHWGSPGGIPHGGIPPWGGSPMGGIPRGRIPHGGSIMGDPQGGSQEGTPADIWTCESETQ